MAAIELGVPYYIYNPLWSEYFAFNAPTDANFVGYISDITGLDDSGVRENAQTVVAGDGGYHGPFWRDRRPWTMIGTIMPQFPLLARDNAQEKIQGILNQCLQSDGYMLWTPADGNQKQLAFRLQQPVRMPKGSSAATRNFQLALVTADYRILGATILTGTINQAGSWITAITNVGNAPSPIKLTVAGPINANGWTVTNLHTGKKVTINQILNTGDTYVLDFTGTYPTATYNGAGVYGTIDPLNTNWDIALAPKVSNTFQLNASGATSNTVVTVTTRSAWT